ncbi:hypothetical protein VKT23_004348 [Stygiomarasmius scandens]|uniref:Uncharacterized protein n=1 Tax=Marasmiellus scandens TaxID=2682957 RepID=A0ABR1JWR2_9AGAR
MVSLMLGGLGAAVAWTKVDLMMDALPLQSEMFLLIQAVTFSLLVILSLLGVIGGVMQIRGIVFVYPRLLVGHCLLVILSFALSLYLALVPLDASVVIQCAAGTRDDLIAQFCKSGWSIVNGLSVCLLGMALPVQVYAFILAINFAEDTEYDDAASISMKFPEIKSRSPIFGLSPSNYDNFLKQSV